jgi:hypothetical protein
MLRVKKVEYLDEYKLNILFSNGRSKVVDFENWIAEENVYLKPLRKIEYFKKVRIDDFNYSICWPNGADFSPDTLFEAGREVKVKGHRPSSKSTRQHIRK